ncbi:MAG: phosphoglycerate kinase [Bacteroidetes bacterium]|nr:phosphoglycerate kinase [Bacteroidota bacterium]
MPKVSIDSLELNGRRVLVRVDFNVPVATDENGERFVSDDTRIRAALPTIRRITEAGGRAVLLSHLGRPNGKPDPALSLAPVAKHLASLLASPVRFVPCTVGPEVISVIRDMAPGDVVLLENTRFLPGEKENDRGLSAQLAEMADVYVNDAFGTAHRAHASTEGVAHLVQTAAMGKLMEIEISFLSRILDSPETPFVAIIGGAKVSDKIGIVERLLDSVDALLIGGAMSYTFMKSIGVGTGDSMVEDECLEAAANLLTRAGDRIRLPLDHVVATSFDNEAQKRIVSGVIPDAEMGLDIGPATVEAYRSVILGAKTLVWNGPMGVFEMPSFASGTIAIARAMAEATERGALTVVGGGDSVAAITAAGLESRVSHVSTGGGAMLEFLEGKTLPGVAALTSV